MLAAVPAAVIASLVAAVSGWPSPLEAPAEILIEWTPVPLANFILDHLGGISRPAALLGALAIVMLIGGIAGALSEANGRGSLARGAGLLVATLLLAGVFVYFVPPSVTATGWWLVGSMAATLGILSVAAWWEERTPHLGARRGAPESRRAMLLRTGTILGGAAILVTLFKVEPLLRALGTKRLFAYRPPHGFAIAGLSDLVTPAGDHYVMDKVLEVPFYGPPGWRLSIGGLVRSALSLDYGALLERPRRNQYVTMECVDNPVGGPLMSTAYWTGIRMDDLLHEAGAYGNTVVFHGADDHAEGIPIDELRRTGALLAYAMNGEVLAREHGYPARLVLPGHYGFKSVKWLDRIEVIRGPYRDDWQTHGWTETAFVHTTARIDVARRSGDKVLLAGVAFAGTRGIHAVEVRVNRGPWQRATLGPALSNSTWRQWMIRLRGQGQIVAEVRAIDDTGAAQEGHRQGSYPDGATGWPFVSV